jgi:hypothetical protein
VRRDQLGLAAYYRGKGHRLFVSLDPTDGLDRSRDADSLVAAGRSLAEPGVRALFRDYCVAVDTLLRPDWLGVASETNLVRLAAPAPLYAGVVAAAGEAAAAVRARDPDVRLFATVQVEVAWGRLPAGGAYAGVAQDRADFPFVQGLGLSSYPYFGWGDPDSLPLDYYTRLVAGALRPAPRRAARRGPRHGLVPDHLHGPRPGQLPAGHRHGAAALRLQWAGHLRARDQARAGRVGRRAPS